MNELPNECTLSRWVVLRLFIPFAESYRLTCWSKGWFLRISGNQNVPVLVIPPTENIALIFVSCIAKWNIYLAQWLRFSFSLPFVSSHIKTCRRGIRLSSLLPLTEMRTYAVDCDWAQFCTSYTWNNAHSCYFSCSRLHIGKLIFIRSWMMRKAVVSVHNQFCIIIGEVSYKILINCFSWTWTFIESEKNCSCENNFEENNDLTMLISYRPFRNVFFFCFCDKNSIACLSFNLRIQWAQNWVYLSLYISWLETLKHVLYLLFHIHKNQLWFGYVLISSLIFVYIKKYLQCMLERF